MPHKRSRLARAKRLQREEDYYALKQLRLNERRLIWLHAFYDELLDEVVNRLSCHWNPIHNGEVLLDSRNRGSFQRLR